jgi:hypothetical protein
MNIGFQGKPTAGEGSGVRMKRAVDGRLRFYANSSSTSLTIDFLQK